MNTYTVSQIQIDELDFYVGSKKEKAYRSATRQGNPRPALNMGLYKVVARIKAESLEDAFRIGNIEHHRVEELAPYHSISVGDLLEVDGQLHFVDRIGFKEIMTKDVK